MHLVQKCNSKVELISYFGKNLIKWYNNSSKREMPWRGELNPYKIWLSEIILQQTRVDQGLTYYNNFIKFYPTVEKLANANENEVFKLWEGLGYYNRCKNLLFTAKTISNNYNGIFPRNYEEILKLKGVGPYTAAAIASFAYNLPFAVVDGNVTRVLSRFYGLNIPINTGEGKKYFAKIAQENLNQKIPAVYNQAIMDFGATVCKPQNPICITCPMQKKCIASNSNSVKNLPVKTVKLAKKRRFFYYIIATYNKKIYVRKRVEKDIWANLWEFILIEKQNKLLNEDFEKNVEILSIVQKKENVINYSESYRQLLTHQIIEANFIVAHLKKPFNSNLHELKSIEEISKLAFPRIITQYFEKNGHSLF